MEQLEAADGRKFYHPDIHVYTSEEDEEKNTWRRGRIPGSWKNLRRYFQKGCEATVEPFPRLASKYQSNTQFSYVCEICFSNVIMELFQENRFAESTGWIWRWIICMAVLPFREIIELQKKISASTRSSQTVP